MARAQNVRIVAGAARAIAGIVATNLLRLLLPVWIASGLVFLIVAASINTLVGVPDVLGGRFEGPALYVVYVILGIAASTLLALPLAAQRSIPEIQRHLDDLTMRIVEAFLQQTARDGSLSTQEVSQLVASMMREIGGWSAGLRRFTPGGALARFLLRRLAPELEALVSACSSMAGPPAAPASAKAISMHASAAAAAQLGNHVKRITIIAMLIWLALFMVAALPLLLARTAR